MNIHTPTKQDVLIVAAVLCIIAGSIFFVEHNAAQPAPSNATEQTATTTPSAFARTVLEANSAIVMDARTGEVLFAKRPDAQQPLASITKVMVALVADSLLQPESTIAMTPTARLFANTPTTGPAREAWQFDAILDYTLMASRNDGAYAIAAAAGSALQDASTRAPAAEQPVQTFLAAMNRQASELGLEHTYFLNPTGLDATQTVGGAYGSAHDVATLFRHILATNPELLAATRAPAETFRSSAHTYRVDNTNAALGSIPGLIGGKTGYTDLSGGNLAVAFDVGLGQPVIAVVLGATENGRFADMQALVRAAYTHYNAQ